MGYGKRSNPLSGHKDLPIVAVVDLSWYGDHWFFDNGDVGLTLINNDFFTVNLITQLAPHRWYFEHTSRQLITFGGTASSGVDNNGVVGDSGAEGDGASNGGDDTPNGDDDNQGNDEQNSLLIPDRDWAIESGIEILADGQWGAIEASISQDISSNHNGFSTTLSYGKNYVAGRWLFSNHFGITWNNQDLNHYYYGVNDYEANRATPPYRADSGYNVYTRFLARYYLSKRWSFAILMDYEQLSSAISDSPFIDNDYIWSVYSGFKYRF
nr:MipA/OmpV family protein [Marinibactrum halimedae]